MEVPGVELDNLSLGGQPVEEEALQLGPCADLWLCGFEVVEVTFRPFVQLINLHQSKLLFRKVAGPLSQIVG